MGVTMRSNKQTTAVAHNNVEGINTTYMTEAIFTPRTSIFIDLIVWGAGLMVASHGRKKTLMADRGGERARDKLTLLLCLSLR